MNRSYRPRMQTPKQLGVTTDVFKSMRRVRYWIRDGKIRWHGDTDRGLLLNMQFIHTRNQNHITACLGGWMAIDLLGFSLERMAYTVSSGGTGEYGPKTMAVLNEVDRIVHNSPNLSVLFFPNASMRETEAIPPKMVIETIDKFCYGDFKAWPLSDLHIAEECNEVC